MQLLHPNAKWYFFFTRSIGSLIVLFILPSYIALFFRDLGLSGIIFVLIFIIYGPIILLTYIWANLFYKSYKYELRDDAFRKEHGVIWKKYVSVPYSRIQNVDIYRGLIARLLGLSDLHIQTAGNSGVTATEGRLPGLDPKTAEELRDNLINRARSNTQASPV
jgi:membrane protein YdbS with pleckstrin-like domain